MSVRLRDLARVAKKQWQLSLLKPDGTSHWKFTDGTVSYPVPCHNGLRTEIRSEYLRGFCKAFAHRGVTLEELMKHQ